MASDLCGDVLSAILQFGRPPEQLDINMWKSLGEDQILSLVVGMRNGGNNSEEMRGIYENVPVAGTVIGDAVFPEQQYG